MAFWVLQLSFKSTRNTDFHLIFFPSSVHYCSDIGTISLWDENWSIHQVSFNIFLFVSIIHSWILPQLDNSMTVQHNPSHLLCFQCVLIGFTETPHVLFLNHLWSSKIVSSGMCWVSFQLTPGRFWMEHTCTLVRWKQLSGEIARVTHSSFAHLSFACSSLALFYCDLQESQNIPFFLLVLTVRAHIVVFKVCGRRCDVSLQLE